MLKKKKKDKRGEKFSSGLIDRASSVGGVIWTMWFIKRTGRGGALLFSQTLHLDALKLCGMVFERFYKNWMYCSTNLM